MLKESSCEEYLVVRVVGVECFCDGWRLLGLWKTLSQTLQGSRCRTVDGVWKMMYGMKRRRVEFSSARSSSIPTSPAFLLRSRPPCDF